MVLRRLQVMIPGRTTGAEDVAVGCDGDICVQAAGWDDNHMGVGEWERRAADSAEAANVPGAGKLECRD